MAEMMNYGCIWEIGFGKKKFLFMADIVHHLFFAFV